MDLLQTWQEEQQRIAAQVIIKEDPKEQDDPHRNEAFKYLQNLPTVTNYYYFGGVDVSFPNNESDPSVAVYVILNGSGTIVYRDYEYFHLTIPYVSSYLSYREIDPLERLVNKQRKEQNKFTPCVILGERRLESGVLGMLPNLALVLGVAAESQSGTSAIRAVRGGGNRGQVVLPIWKGKAVAKRAVGTQLNGPAADGHFCIGFGCAVDDELGVDIEPESFLRHASERA